MNLGYIRDTLKSRKRPASRWEIECRVKQYRTWKVLVLEENPDRFEIKIERTEDGGYRASLYHAGDPLAEQQHIWYPTL